MTRSALVTGGAKGIGRALTARLAADGHDVVAVGRDGEAVRACERDLRGSQGRVRGLIADVSDPAAVDALVAELGGVDILVLNAGIAVSNRVARTSLDRPAAESMSLFYIQADLPGFRVGRRTHMMGMKTGHHAELVFENVRIPGDCRLGAEGAALDILAAVLGQGLGAQFVGLARGAYHYALNYAKQRRSYGKPLIEHQAIALLLADMEIETQAARLLSWDAICAAERFDASAMIKGMGSKLYAVDVAMKTAQNAVKILGGYGVTREYLAAKYLCDALMGYSCDFTGDMLRLRIAACL